MLRWFEESTARTGTQAAVQPLGSAALFAVRCLLGLTGCCVTHYTAVVLQSFAVAD